MRRASNQLGTILPAALLLPLLLLAPVAQHALGLWRQAASRPQCPADVLVVMGAAQYDGQPSPVFERRLDGALELYAQGCAPMILVTGGKREGDRFSEGESGARYLLARGVPAGALLSERESKSSLENLSLSHDKLEGKRVLIVTDDMHAYRSRYLARKLGLDAEAAPVTTKGPRLGYALREILIVTAYSFGLR